MSSLNDETVFMLTEMAELNNKYNEVCNLSKDNSFFDEHNQINNDAIDLLRMIWRRAHTLKRQIEKEIKKKTGENE